MVLVLLILVLEDFKVCQLQMCVEKVQWVFVYNWVGEDDLCVGCIGEDGDGVIFNFCEVLVLDLDNVWVC